MAGFIQPVERVSPALDKAGERGTAGGGAGGAFRVSSHPSRFVGVRRETEFGGRVPFFKEGVRKTNRQALSCLLS